ncbi:MAG: Ig-like domain-containing protein [Acidobacteriia bacterium]|nr:Ig-like domain-containing protein [Terriglobia bacterium]
MRKTVRWVLGGIGLAIMSACGGSSGGGPTQVTPPPTLTSLSISPSNPIIANGTTQQFKAKAGYSDGSTSDVTAQAAWVSSDPSRATIETAGQTDPGLATAVSAKSPSPNIQATFDGITALTVLDITTTAPQTGLSLGQINPSIAPGATLQLIAVANYQDGSTQTVTDSSTWQSTNQSTATVGANTGLLTGVAPGLTTVGAIAGGFPASSPVTVASNAAEIPLMDMTSSQNYLGFPGGLYENNSKTPPPDHDAAGKAAAKAIQPLDQNGNPSPKGAVVFLGIGMSNATIEFSAFVTAAATDSKINNTTLAIEDGAHGAVTACPWTVAQGPASTVCGATGVPAENQYDRVRDTVLATAVGAPSAPSGCGTTSNPCLTEAQVQIIWMKNANPDPGLNNFSALSSSTICANELPKPKTEACYYELQMGKIVRAARSRYPNLKQIFLSTRIYAGYAPKPLNPEPYAYEYGFSGKWLVQAQINQIRNGTVDPVAGDMDYTTGMAAWTAWGPYLWANGINPRSDGLIWCDGQTGAPCNGEVDFQPDGTHPNSTSGAQKVVNQLMTFFKTSAYTPSWFCKTATACP